MPDAEDSARDSGKGIGREMHYGKGGGKAAVLHADFDADGHALGFRQSEDTAKKEADGETEQVV